ncbi:nucleotide-diphospho-sugar transferase [Spirosoma flavum]|uniref:Nucleotide-diphospho-sugar transferase n=1 Tax=Spirosoma flavum TaxID=2048557 RepID=A0ABW6ARY8_9BACT
MPTAPVLFIIFNRPVVTQTVFTVIREARPKQLFVAADGPRPHKAGEASLCEQTRQIINQIDWDCAVYTLFQEQNLGCKRAVSSAIDWFFSHAEEGIILEDDCLPDLTFFSFCTDLLIRYRSNERVMHIGGITFQPDNQLFKEASYYFSGFTPIWGWATWRRAWAHYKVDPTDNLRNLKLEPPYFSDRQQWYIKQVQAGRMDTWDVQWLVAVRSHNGLSIIPAVSLIRNIGFGMDATHTLRQPKWLDQLRYGSITHLVHPSDISINQEADWYEAQHIHRQPWYMKFVEFVYFPIKALFSR